MNCVWLLHSAGLFVQAKIKNISLTVSETHQLQSMFVPAFVLCATICCALLLTDLGSAGMVERRM